MFNRTKKLRIPSIFCHDALKDEVDEAVLVVVLGGHYLREGTDIKK